MLSTRFILSPFISFYSVILFLGLCLINNQGISQVSTDFSGKKDAWVLTQANRYYENESYIDAIPYLEHLNKKDSNNMQIAYKLAVSNTMQNFNNNEALNLLNRIFKSEKYTKKYPETEFYIAKVLHQMSNYDKAIQHYSNYQLTTPKEDTLYSVLNLYIEQCNLGKKLTLEAEENKVILIHHLDSSINTKDYEYMPIITADEEKLFFTYRGEKSIGGKINSYGEPDTYGNTYGEDIYYSEKKGSTWTLAKPIENLNTKFNDGVVALLPDGQTMIIYRNIEDSAGNLYQTQLVGDNWTLPITIGHNINSEYWEGSACLNHNNTLLIFSSDRPGGFGGRDLYYSKKEVNGEWGIPENMGAKINSAYDEDSPFLFYDGKTLYYSNNGKHSIGGYDIVYSTYEDSIWSLPNNVGIKINTPLDNKFYTLTADGHKAYFSSMLPDGNGLQDIYMATPGHFADNQSYVLKGVTFLNDEIGKVEIAISTKSIGKMNSKHHSNKNTGKYLLAFPDGWEYLVTFSAEGYEPYTIDLDLKNVGEYKDSLSDVYLFTSEMFDKYMNVSGIAYDSITGEPIAGTWVILTAEDGSYQDEVVTDENGFYLFRKVPKGKNYNLFIKNPNGGTAKLNGKITDLYNKKGIENVKINEQFTDSQGKYLINSDDSTGDDTPFPVAFLTPYSKGNVENALTLDLETYKKILAKYGNSSAKGLVFRIQVGAYKKPKKFIKNIGKDFEAIDELQKSKKKDKITRFTIGTYLTLNDAEQKKQRARALHSKDAFIAIYYKGQRMLFSKDFLTVLSN